jgi:uncharacterized protein YecE (DUF72 family)
MMPSIPSRVFYVGCAGWSVPKPFAAHFPTTGSHLERYASVFPGVEINTSFYRPHQFKTYVKWAGSVPSHFRFAVKVPKSITHNGRLTGYEAEMDRFLDECAGLGDKLGPLLVQLPPSLQYNRDTVDEFCTALRARFAGDVVCEPRHRSWFTPEAQELLVSHHIARVAADPALTAAASEPGGWSGLRYFRLHGSPQMYYSEYSVPELEALAQRMVSAVAASHVAPDTSAATTNPVPVWCIFDNTAAFAATGNALSLWEQLQEN